MSNEASESCPAEDFSDARIMIKDENVLYRPIDCIFNASATALGFLRHIKILHVSGVRMLFRDLIWLGAKTSKALCR